MNAYSEPKPCKRYSKRIPLNGKFLAHLPGCDACRRLVLYLRDESDKLRRKNRERRHDHRGRPNWATLTHV
jgi:hypothetical protein